LAAAILFALAAAARLAAAALLALAAAALAAAANLAAKAAAALRFAAATLFRCMAELRNEMPDKLSHCGTKCRRPFFHSAGSISAEIQTTFPFGSTSTRAVFLPSLTLNIMRRRGWQDFGSFAITEPHLALVPRRTPLMKHTLLTPRTVARPYAPPKFFQPFITRSGVPRLVLNTMPDRLIQPWVFPPLIHAICPFCSTSTRAEY
jgi:hypothetical protein